MPRMDKLSSYKTTWFDNDDDGGVTMAQVHRFHDKCAVSLGTGETVYLSPKTARQLSSAINKVCRSIEREPFLQSRGTTFQIEGPEQ